MEEDKRELIISWLETNQGNGFFEGFEEENMNFEKMNDDELEWYYDNWVVTDTEEEEETEEELLNQKKS